VDVRGVHEPDPALVLPSLLFRAEDGHQKLHPRARRQRKVVPDLPGRGPGPDQGHHGKVSKQFLLACLVEIFISVYQLLCCAGGGARKERSPTPRPVKIHVGRLTRNVTKDHLQEIFGCFGGIKVSQPSHIYLPTRFGRVTIHNATLVPTKQLPFIVLFVLLLY